MPKVNLNIDIEDLRWSAEIPAIETVAENTKNALINYMSDHADIEIFESNRDISVNLCLSDDAHIRTLNRTFRGKDKPTNVLSFANMDFTDFAAQNNLYNDIELGDIIMAYETTRQEAETEHITLHDHFCHLLVHGILHLLGYDHIEADEAEIMEGYEISVLQTLNIANPYEEE